MNITANRLQQLLYDNHMSYGQLAEITNINKATLHRYATNKTIKIPSDRLWTIAFALNTTPQYLIGSTNDPNPQYLNQYPHIDERLFTLISSADKNKYLKALLYRIASLDDKQIKTFIALVDVILQEEA